MSDSGTRHTTLPLFAAWRTHRGNFRKNNEDSVLVVSLDDTAAPPPSEGQDSGAHEGATDGRGYLALVCDGVGGGAAGEVASATAVGALLEALRALIPADSPDTQPEATRLAWLQEAVTRAHRKLLDAIARDRALEGMGTTMTAAWFCGPHLHLAQVGDSRLYRLRAGRFEQLSADQSFVGRLRRSGSLTEEEARRHPLRNIIDQVVGGSEQGVHPDLSCFPIADGDEYIVCSDGLSDSLTDGAITQELVDAGREDVNTVADKILQHALNVGGRDNVTLIHVRVGKARAGAIESFVSRLVTGWKRHRERTEMEGRASENGTTPPPPEDGGEA